MQLSLPHKILILLATILAIVAVVAAVNFLIIRYRGEPVPAPEIPRAAETYGTDKPLRYAVLGDSTTVSQGGDYDEGYARETSRYLADQGYRVTLKNFGQSGAVAADVARKQAPEAAEFRPDVALIAVAANDVTHLTSLDTVESNLKSSIEKLRQGNPDVQIVLTGSPAMGTIPRFPQPARYLAGVRTEQVNTVVRGIVDAHEAVHFAPIAARTGPIFDARPTELYALDLFHPNTAGYRVWTPVLTEALSAALTNIEK